MTSHGAVNARNEYHPRRLLAWETGLYCASALALAYFAVFAAASIMRYLNFHGGNDIVDYAQMLWNTVHGRPLAKTDIYGVGTGLRGGHTEPILLLLAVPYALIPDPRTMLVLQTLALASCGPLVYILARAHGHRQQAAVVLAAFFYLYPSVQYATIHEFHPDPFAVATLLISFIAFEYRRWRLLAVGVALTLLAKEQLVLFVFGQGCYWWLARGARRVGLLVIGASVLYAFAVLLPWYLATRQQYTHDYTGFFAQVQSALQGHDGASGIRGVLTALGTILGDPTRRTNMLLSLLPTGFLFLLDSSALIAFLPLLGLFLSNRPTNDVWFHHYVTSVPVLVFAISRVLARPRFAGMALGLSVVLVTWAALLGALYAQNPTCMMYWVYHPSVLLADDRSRAQAAFIQAVPAGVNLDANAVLGAHLANRTDLYLLQVPSQARLVPYVLIDLYPDIRDVSAAGQVPSQVDFATLVYLRAAGGFRLLRQNTQYGLYLYANCRGFPHTTGCA